MSSTRFSSVASEAARFIEVVVFPTPPFWLANAMILPIKEIVLSSFCEPNIVVLVRGCPHVLHVKLLCARAVVCKGNNFSGKYEQKVKCKTERLQ